MASSEVLDWHSAKQQLEHFEEARQVMRSAGFEPELLHVSNTCAAIARREAWYNMVRPGLGLYGYHLPFQRSGKVVGEKKLELKPILTWKTRVLTVREVAAGRPLGYGGTHVTCRPSRIAVLPVGYADGLNRQLSSRGRVIVRGHHAPVVGRISMNLTLVDVTDIPAVTNEDEVVLLGSDAGLSVDAQEHAELSNTISYEILCSISKRVPRQYCS
jgi:alanine racemase